MHRVIMNKIFTAILIKLVPSLQWFKLFNLYKQYNHNWLILILFPYKI